MLHLRTLRKGMSLGVPEGVRPGPPPRSRWGYYLLIILVLLFFFAAYLYHFHFLVKASGLVVGDILSVRSPIKGEVVSIAELGGSFDEGAVLVRVAPHLTFDEIPFLQEKQEALEAVYEDLQAKRWALLREKRTLEQELSRLDDLYRRHLITISERMALLSSLRGLEAQILSFEQSLKRLDLELLDLERKMVQAKKLKEPFSYQAPTQGFVLERLVIPGSLVFPGDYLLRVSQGPPKYILAYFPLDKAQYVTPGLKVSIKLPGGEQIEGQVAEILPEAAYKPPFILRAFERREMALQVLVEFPANEKLVLREPVQVSFRRPISIRAPFISRDDPVKKGP